MAEAFTPGRATLTARVFANPHARVPPTLFYDIAFPVRVSLPVPVGRPLFATDEPVTEVQLEFINLGPVEWRALPGREFGFPSGPDHEYPDGGVYLGGTHHSAFLTRLRSASCGASPWLPCLISTSTCRYCDRCQQGWSGSFRSAGSCRWRSYRPTSMR